MKKLFPVLSLLVFPVVCGCVMMGAWKSIPPPGGCDRCHTVPIGNRWAVSYTPVQLDDGSGRPAFQRPDSAAAAPARPTSSLELRKEQDEKCFDCHKAPSAAHRNRTGSYHH